MCGKMFMFMYPAWSYGKYLSGSLQFWRERIKIVMTGA